MKLLERIGIWYTGLGPAMKFGVTGILTASVIFAILGNYIAALAGVFAVAIHFGNSI